MTSTSRTARCGPACRVVWQGSVSYTGCPYADRELDKRAFNELFYGRTNENLEFSNALEIIAKTGENFIIVGDAGVGKSTYLYKFFLNEDNELNKHIYPIFIDFRKGAVDINSALLSFIDKLDSYFIDVGSPIHTLRDQTDESKVKFNLIKISEHFISFTPRNDTKQLLLFVDDLDYADDYWLEFLLTIQHLITSPKICFILSLRPLLEFKIRASNDVLYRSLVRSAKRIELGSLPIQDILHSRLAPILRENEENHLIRAMKRLFKRDSALCRILRKSYGITTIDQLARFEFPFSGKLLDFMTQITNGNIREVFDIAETILRYIFVNAPKLATRIEDGETKYVIPREALMELFGGKANVYSSNYQLFNLHETRNSNGFSLHYNVLVSNCIN